MEELNRAAALVYLEGVCDAFLATIEKKALPSGAPSMAEKLGRLAGVSLAAGWVERCRAVDTLRELLGAFSGAVKNRNGREGREADNGEALRLDRDIALASGNLTVWLNAVIQQRYRR